MKIGPSVHAYFPRKAQERRGYSIWVDYSTVESTAAVRTVIVGSL
jgi:hypothetical protein